MLDRESDTLEYVTCKLQYQASRTTWKAEQVEEEEESPGKGEKGVAPKKAAKQKASAAGEPQLSPKLPDCHLRRAP